MLKITTQKERPFCSAEHSRVLSLLVDARKGRSVVLNPETQFADHAANGPQLELDAQSDWRCSVPEPPFCDRIR